MQPSRAKSRHLQAVRRQIEPPWHRRYLWRALAGMLVGAAAIGAGLAFWLPQPPAPDAIIELRPGTVEIAIQADAMVVRTERVYTAPARGHARRLADDGQRVRVGAPVVAILSGGPEESAGAPAPVPVSEAASRRELEQISAELYRLATEAARARDLGDGEAQARYQAELDRVGLRQWELSRQLGSAQAPIAIPAPPPGGRLEAEVLADSAGILVYQIDGLEAVLTPTVTSGWTPSWFRSLVTAPRPTAEGPVAVGDPIFKVVDNLTIGLLLLVSEGALPAELPADGRVQLHFPAWPGRLVAARITAVEREGGEVLLHLSAPVFPGELTGLRRVRVTLLFERYGGMVAPRSAIDIRDGKQGVWVHNQGDPYFHPVRVLGGNAQEVALETSLQAGTRLLRTAPKDMR